jgi:hypothetical protein
MPSKLLLASAIMSLFTTAKTHAGIPLQDMYMSNSDGVVYHIDGSTLHATEVFQFNNTNWPVQIEYMKDGRIGGNLTDRIDAFDLDTGIQETLVYSTEFDTNSQIGHATGLAVLDDGRLMTTVLFHYSTSLWTGAGFYDPSTQSVSGIRDSTALVQDLHHLHGSTMLVSFTRSDEPRYYLYDYIAGTVFDIRDSGIPLNSFVENNGQLFALSDNGELYQFDYLTGALSLHGTITGFKGDSNSITIPSPTTFAPIAVGLLLSQRRRSLHSNHSLNP